MMKLNIGIYGYAIRPLRSLAHIRIGRGMLNLVAKGQVYQFTSGECTYYFVVDGGEPK